MTMPMLSKAQNAAMHAAASGNSTLGIPKRVGQEFVNAGPAGKTLPERVGSHSVSAHLGLSNKPKKRSGHGKPGAHHLSALTHAHGAGDFAKAKTHALNYAKAIHQHMNASAPDPMPSPDADDVSVDAGPTPTPSQPASTAGTAGGLGKLMALMKKRS